MPQNGSLPIPSFAGSTPGREHATAPQPRHPVTRPVSGSSNALREALEAARRQLEQAPQNSGSALDGVLDQAFESALGELNGDPRSKSSEGVSRRPFEHDATDSPVAGALDAVDGELRSAERLPFDLLSGQISGPAELAVRIQRARLTFNYTLAIRDRLVEAYREVMRMTV